MSSPGSASTPGYARAPSSPQGNHANARKIARFLREGKQGRAQRLATGFGTFAGPVSHGAYQQLVIRNHRGWYVLACFMETQDGRDHTRLGMERVTHVVK